MTAYIDFFPKINRSINCNSKDFDDCSLRFGLQDPMTKDWFCRLKFQISEHGDFVHLNINTHTRRDARTFGSKSQPRTQDFSPLQSTVHAQWRFARVGKAQTRKDKINAVVLDLDRCRSLCFRVVQRSGVNRLSRKGNRARTAPKLPPLPSFLTASASSPHGSSYFLPIHPTAAAAAAGTTAPHASARRCRCCCGCYFYSPRPTPRLAFHCGFCEGGRFRQRAVLWCCCVCGGAV